MFQFANCYSHNQMVKFSHPDHPISPHRQIPSSSKVQPAWRHGGYTHLHLRADAQQPKLPAPPGATEERPWAEAQLAGTAWG